MAGVFSIVPALPILADQLGVSDSAAAYLIVSFTLGNILISPFVGLASDSLGRRKILVPSLMVFGVAGALCGVTNEFSVMLILRFIQGIGSAALATVAVTVLSDRYAGESRVRYFGYNMTATSVGMMFYPYMGGVLASIDGRYPFFLSAIAVPIGFYVHLFMRYSEPLSNLRLSDFFGQFSRSLLERRVILASYLNLTAFVIFAGAFLAFFALLVQKKFTEDVAIDLAFSTITLSPQVFSGLAIVVFSSMVGVVSLQLGRLHNAFGFNRVLATAFVGYSVGFLAIPAADSAEWLLAGCAVLGLAHGCAVPSIVALYTRLAPSGMVGSYVILNSIVFRAGQTIGPMIFGFVLLVSDVQQLFVVAACSAIPAAFVAAITRWRTAD